MPRFSQLTVTLPEGMVAMVRDKVAAGEYQSESDVVRDGLHALQAGDVTLEDLAPEDVAPEDVAPEDLALEDWLAGEVVSAFDAMRADPSRALSVEQVRASFATLHEEKFRDGA
jgi:antitoxin ParD1/3/4